MGKSNLRNERWQALRKNAAEIGIAVEEHGDHFWLVGRGRAIVFQGYNTRWIKMALATVRKIKQESNADGEC